MDALLNAQYGFAPALASALLHALWQDTLLAFGAALSMAALHRRSPALRHAVGMGFLLAMVVMPALLFLDFWRLPGTLVNTGVLPAMTSPRMGGIPGVFVQEPGPMAGGLAVLWLLGVTAMLLRHFGGWRWLGVLERRPFAPLPPDWQQRVLALQGAMGITRTVAVRLAADVVAPFTARLFRPVIWLPLTLLKQLPVAQLEALLAHELAHIRRLDWLWNGIQCVVESLLFFHPGVWWLSRRIRQEREHACDDLAVAACGDAIALAEALAELERQRHPSPRLVLAAHGGSLMQRVTRLLSGSSSRARWRIPAALAIVLVSGGLLATQVDIPGKRSGLHIRSTTDGVLGPGDVREVTANGLDGERYYRVSADAQGRLIEVYKEDGKVRPIDGKVRRWISEVDRLSVPPIPPPPPKPPMAPMPPLPPAPPMPPDLADSVAFKSIARLVAADPDVIARLGSPIVVRPQSVTGSITLDGWNDSEGTARLNFHVSGPKGSARALTQAERDSGTWKLVDVALRTSSR